MIRLRTFLLLAFGVVLGVEERFQTEVAVLGMLAEVEEHLRIEVAVLGMLAEVEVVQHSSSIVVLVEPVVGVVVDMSVIVRGMLALLAALALCWVGILWYLAAQGLKKRRKRR